MKVNLIRSRDKFDTTPPIFLDIYEKQFQLDVINDGEIRIYSMPSFEIETLYIIKKYSVKKCSPLSKSIWENIQIVNENQNGSISGRVGNVSDSLPLLKLDCKVVKNPIFYNMFRKLDSIKLGEMKNISKEGWVVCDGTMLIVHSKINGKENKFSFSSATYYHDERYNWISQVFGKHIHKNFSLKNTLLKLLRYFRLI